MQLQVELLSETTFGRGEGTAGIVDTEIDHDPVTGLPFIHARTLKGLLVEACSDILYSLEQFDKAAVTALEPEALYLFGVPGSTLGTDARLKIDHAAFSPAFVAAVAASGISPQQALDAWTEVRTQTAANTLGVPDEGSLRSVRVLRRGTTLHAPLTFDPAPSERALALLDAVVRSTHRAGLSRNRGRGRVQMRLVDANGKIIDYTADFERYITGEAR
jgi:CRISPR/Cas system CSM-associated protein Csm3 (group 7 of RAMP superfamily)